MNTENTTMTQTHQPEALRLAEQCDNFANRTAIATCLRAQHYRILELEGSVTHLDNVYGAAMRKVVELEQGKCLHQIAEHAAAPFMYAIADGYGNAFFEEQGCVSSEAKDLQPEVDSLNQNLDGEPPYAVVPVYTHPTAQGVDALTPAARDVLAERQRQVEQEGYNPEHDDGHVNDEIAAMAAIFVMPEAARDWDARSTNYGNTLAEALLPADWNFPHLGNRRDQLVKGAAMALAEIERIDRGSCYA